MLNGTALELGNTAQPVTVTGPAAGLTISGKRKSGVFVVDAGVTAAVSGVTLRDGVAANYGGGINSAGDLTLTNVALTRNATTGDLGTGDGGGAVYNKGTLVLDHCTLSDNVAGDAGGGLGNVGAATVTNCTFSANTSRAGGAGGGGIYNQGTLSVSDSTLADNRATGGRRGNGGAGSFGGGLVNYQTATLTNCTVVANRSAVGGGVSNSGTAALVNCTLARNVAADGSGGGLEVEFIDSGGPTGPTQSAPTTLANTLVADNRFKKSPDNSGPDVDGTVVSSGFNLVGDADGSGGWTGTDLTGTGAYPLDAKLGPLADNGGPTHTVRPAAGSLALGRGSTRLVPQGLTTDQRGKPRTLDGATDIGAVEVGGGAVQPFLHAPAAQDVTAGQTAAVQVGTLDDPAAAGPWRVTIRWGDGTAPTQLRVTSPGDLPATPHNFPAAGTDTLAVSVTDRSGRTSNVATSLVRVAPAGGVLVVNSTSDRANETGGGDRLSLRGAIALANLYKQPTTVRFDPRVFARPQTIKLQDDSLEITNATPSVTIAGPAAGVTLDGGDRFGAFTIDQGAVANLSLLTIVRGSSSGSGGGGIDNSGTLALSRCTIAHSATGGYGGAIYNETGATAAVQDCTFFDNASYGQGPHYSTAPGDGGAVYNDNDGTMTLVNCTLDANQATFGGAIENAGKLELDDCTVSGNAAPDFAGDPSGVYSQPTPGKGGGIYNIAPDPASEIPGGTLTLANTIVAANSASAGPDVSGAAQSRGANLIGKTDGGTGWQPTDLTGTSASPLDPRLGKLADNGGPTLTQLPQPGSPALGHGSASLLPPGLATDQRGQPRLTNGQLDIGAAQT